MTHINHHPDQLDLEDWINERKAEEKTSKAKKEKIQQDPPAGLSGDVHSLRSTCRQKLLDDNNSGQTKR